MTILVDTSGLYAYIAADDENHLAARRGWERLVDDGDDLVTHSYVLVETTALLQKRMGVDAVKDLHRVLVPAMDVHWVGADDHQAAFTALAAADRRGVSIVDQVSFHVMRTFGIQHALAFDRHFADEGFELVTEGGTG